MTTYSVPIRSTSSVVEQPDPCLRRPNANDGPAASTGCVRRGGFAEVTSVIVTSTFEPWRDAIIGECAQTGIIDRHFRTEALSEVGDLACRWLGALNLHGGLLAAIMAAGPAS
jgi:hypothetical protein